jgi:RNA polymerase sigma-54 factor
MRQETQLSVRNEQRLMLLPKMLQSIEVLQLSTVELLARIEQESSQNETLEVSPAAGTETAIAARPAHDDDDFERGEGSARNDDDDPRLRWLQSLEARPGGLLEHIRAQLAWEGLKPQLFDAVMALAECLDERGYLTLSEDELARRCGRLLPEALATLRALEPRGIGARDAVDALLLQVAADDPDRKDLEALLREHLPALARNRLPDVAKALDRTLDELQLLLTRLRRLELRPGARFAVEKDESIRPDASIRLGEQGIEVRIDDRDLPFVGIDESYRGLAASRATAPDVRRYLREKLAGARELIEAIEQRRRTLQRVCAAVMGRQLAFLREGAARIAPLRMSAIAAELGLHTSTVSRAIAGKYVQTDFGILRLRDFFDGGEHDAPGATADRSRADTGRMGVKERIRQLVSAEDPSRPWSDDDLVQQLRAQGIDVARRTIAKYRQELRIPSSWLRRKHLGGA